jgi:hypothetical protein
MTADTATAPVAAPTWSPEPPPTPGWWALRRARQHLRRQDELSAQRAELHGIRALALEAARIVDAGWIRGGWFGYRVGDRLLVVGSAAGAGRFGDRPVAAACLVGAIVQAGGGVAAVRTQPVQRALDLTWHTLHGDPGEPVHWCPAPSVRAGHVRELVRWNDHPTRTRQQVTALLVRVAAAADAEPVT